MIEGISLLHRTRLKELGIDNVQNLASANFVELMVQTPFNEEILITWILEAKLVVIFGESAFKLRDVGITDAASFREVLEDPEVGVPGLQTATKLSEETLRIAYVQICKDQAIVDLESFRDKNIAYGQGEAE